MNEQHNNNTQPETMWQKIKAFVKRVDEKEVQKKPTFGVRGRQLIFLAGILGFSVFVGYHLLKFTVIDGDMWRERANSQQSGQSVIKANRGTIYDANGTVLAQSSAVWNVIFAQNTVQK